MLKACSAILSALFFLISGLPALATVIPLSQSGGLPPVSVQTSFQAGDFRVTNLDGGLHTYYFTGGYFDPFGAYGPSATQYSSLNGALFSLNSFDVFSGWLVLTGAPQFDFSVTGYRDGNVVALTFGSSEFGDHLMTFGNAFGSIDSFVIDSIYTYNWCGTPPVDGVCFTPTADIHFNIANIDVTFVERASPVPLPASAGLMLAALAAFGLLAHRKRNIASGRI